MNLVYAVPAVSCALAIHSDQDHTFLWLELQPWPRDAGGMEAPCHTISHHRRPYCTRPVTPRVQTLY